MFHRVFASFNAHLSLSFCLQDSTNRNECISRYKLRCVRNRVCETLAHAKDSIHTNAHKPY